MQLLRGKVASCLCALTGQLISKSQRKFDFSKGQLKRQQKFDISIAGKLFCSCPSNYHFEAGLETEKRGKKAKSSFEVKN